MTRLSPFIGPVGLQVDPAAPAGAEAWRSSYARVLLVQVPAATPEALREAWERNESWLAAALTDAERDGARVDGYLLLQLPAGDVSIDVEREARVAELDVHVCRKAVLRPAEDAGIDAALARVPVLALPDAPPVVVEAPLGDPPDAARRIEAWLAAHGVEAAFAKACAWAGGDDEAR